MLQILNYYNLQFLNNSAPINLTADWSQSKFQMVVPGTNESIPSGGFNLSSGLSTAATGPTSFYEPEAPVSAEWFTITISSTESYSFLQLYNN